MTAALLAVLLSTHACPAGDVWTSGGGDLVATVVCASPAGEPVPHRVTLAAARKWPAGKPCTAWIRILDVTTQAAGDWRSSGHLLLCVPARGGGVS